MIKLAKKKEVIQQLITENKSQREISNILNVSQTTVRRWLNTYNLKTLHKRKGGKLAQCIEEVQCLNCETIITNATTNKRKYCNSICHREYTTKETYKKMEKGEKVCSTTIRRLLLWKRKNICEICNLEYWNNLPIPLIVDHINGNSYNDSLKNLRLICPNCDAQLPTYKGRNLGKGRHKRRERYKNNKSY